MANEMYSLAMVTTRDFRHRKAFLKVTEIFFCKAFVRCGQVLRGFVRLLNGRLACGRRLKLNASSIISLDFIMGNITWVSQNHCITHWVMVVQ